MADRIKNIETKLLEGVAGGYITGSEYNKYTNQLMPYKAKVLDAIAKGNFDDDGLFTIELGYGNMVESIKEVLKAINLDVATPEKLKGLEREQYYFLVNNIMESYIKSMEKQFEELKQNDTEGKYKNVNNWIEFQDKVKRGKRKQIYKRALAEAINNYSTNELNINKNLIIDKETGEVVDTSQILNTINKKTNNRNVIVLFNTINGIRE